MTSRKRFWWMGWALLLALCVSFPALAAEKKWPNAEGYWLPEAASTYALEIDRLFYGILYLTGFVFLVTEFLLLFFLFKYRRQDGRKAVYTHGNHKLELVWTVTPAVILLAIAVIQKGTWDKIKKNIPEGPNVVKVQLFAEQFSWNFRYAGNDGVWGTKDDVLTVKELYAPVNKDIVIEQTSKDVIHSLFLPYMRLKQDVVPGMHIKVWFNAMKSTADMRKTRPAVTIDGKTQEWDYEIVCAELCGSEHSQMRGKMYILDEATYEATMKKKSAEYLAGDYEPEKIWDLWKVNEAGVRQYPERKKEVAAPAH